MIKYQTGGYYGGGKLIDTVEVVKETAKQLVILRKDPISGREYEDRVAKTSGYYQHHDTWEDAHAYLVAESEREVEAARMALERAKGKLGQRKGLQKPESP